MGVTHVPLTAFSRRSAGPRATLATMRGERPLPASGEAREREPGPLRAGSARRLFGRFGIERADGAIGAFRAADGRGLAESRVGAFVEAAENHLTGWSLVNRGDEDIHGFIDQ